MLLVLTKTVFNGPLYTSDKNISMPKHVAINEPRTRDAKIAKGICKACRASRFVAGNTWIVSPVTGSVASFSCRNSLLFCCIAATPFTPQRIPRSNSCRFQYSTNVTHQRQLTIAYMGEKDPKRTQAENPKAAGNIRN